MRITPSNAQHIGKRSSQQDAFGFSDIFNEEFSADCGVLAVLCDGMGGMQAGDQASRIAVQTMCREFARKSSDETPWDGLKRALGSANRAVCDLAAKLDKELGTTLVAALLFQNKFYWVSVGDSRVYLYRSGQLIKLTTDHNYAMELACDVQRGLITSEEALRHPDRHALVSFIGMGDLKYIDTPDQPLPIQPGDRILLCSDGLYNCLADSEICSILNDQSGDAADRLVQAVLSRNLEHQDNVTAALLSCVEGEELSETEKAINFTTGKSKSHIQKPKFAKYLTIILLITAVLLGTLGIYAGQSGLLNKVKTSLGIATVQNAVE